jgi:hypothetical protein
MLSKGLGGRMVPEGERYRRETKLILGRLLFVARTAG